MATTKELTATEVPAEFRVRSLNRFFVEFLNLGDVIEPGDEETDAPPEWLAKNHVAVKVNFAEAVPGGWLGARISMEPNMTNEPDHVDPGDLYKPGRLKVVIQRYTEPSTSALKTVRFPLFPQTTLGKLIDVATSNKLHLFRFVCLPSGAFMGCRDFIVQYFHLLRIAKIVRQNTTHGSGTFNEIIQYRYSPRYEWPHPVVGTQGEEDVIATQHPITKGFFLEYHRLDMPDMDY